MRQFQTGGFLAIVFLASILGGCQNPDHVLFVTQTNIGVGADMASSSAHVGYDRIEAFAGPDYPQSGGLPPVVASLQSDLAFINPAVKQYYATGDAALVATGRITVEHGIAREKLTAEQVKGMSPAARCALNMGCEWASDGDRRLAVVATNTHVGFVVKTKEANLSSVDFGFGRQEASILPLLQNANKTGDIYPSTFASISVDTATNGGELGNGSGLKLAQFIATGDAATMLASNNAISGSFKAMGAAAAEQQSQSLAQTFGLSAERSKQIVAAQVKGIAEVRASASAVVARITGIPADQDRDLASDDIQKLTAAVNKLSGDAADTSTARGKAMLMLKKKTAGEVRDWLTDRTDILNALDDATKS